MMRVTLNEDTGTINSYAVWRLPSSTQNRGVLGALIAGVLAPADIVDFVSKDAGRVVRPATPSGRAKKGYRVERELAALHAALDIRAERMPLSGALAKRIRPDFGDDLKIWLWGPGEPPATAEVKARAEGGGFATLERWLAGHDALILKRNGLPPMVLLPWFTWARLLSGVGHRS